MFRVTWNGGYARKDHKNDGDGETTFDDAQAVRLFLLGLLEEWGYPCDNPAHAPCRRILNVTVDQFKEEPVAPKK